MRTRFFYKIWTKIQKRQGCQNVFQKSVIREHPKMTILGQVGGSKIAHKYGHYRVEIIGHGRYLDRSKWPKNVGINRQFQGRQGGPKKPTNIGRHRVEIIGHGRYLQVKMAKKRRELSNLFVTSKNETREPFKTPF